MLDVNISNTFIKKNKVLVLICKTIWGMDLKEMHFIAETSPRQSC